MTETLPAILITPSKELFPVLVSQETDLLQQARKLFDAEFYDHALLDIWNASVHNLRRRVEAYGVDLFLSVVKDEPGRKRYDLSGDTLNERWQDVDDLTLISGATSLGLLNRKAGKALEMINWMRNHASPAHGTDSKVEKEDVMGLVLLLQKNLFESPLPDPGHSVSSLFEPVKTATLSKEQEDLLRDQVRGLRQQDLRICFGFMLDMLCLGNEPALQNTKSLFPLVWERATEDLKKTAGIKYHQLSISPDTDESLDKGSRVRLLDFLIQVNGIQYIPDAARAVLFRHAAKQLAKAKDTSYGWSSEVTAAATLKQLGPSVPSICFEEVYQEILAVWCGNYWGRSGAHALLQTFIDRLNTDQIRSLVSMFRRNRRVRDELHQTKPKARGIELLNALRERVTIASHVSEVDSATTSLEEM
jgi:hypothetical protein